MHKYRKSVFVLIAALTTTACSFVFSLDDYEGPAKSGEGGTTGTSSGAASSGGTSGTGTSSGSTSGTPNLDAGGQNPDGSFCPTNALICDDFERDPLNVRGSWDALNAAGAQISLAPGTPTGQAFKMSVVAGATPLTAALTKDFGAIATKATITSRVFFTVGAGGGGMHLNALVFNNGAGQTYSKVFPFLLGASGLAVSELRCDPSYASGCKYAQSTIVPLEQNKWHDITFITDFTTKPATLTLFVDGSIAIQAASQLDAQPGPLQAQAAAAFIDSNHGDYELMFDNVAVSGQ